MQILGKVGVGVFQWYIPVVLLVSVLIVGGRILKGNFWLEGFHLPQ